MFFIFYNKIECFSDFLAAENFQKVILNTSLQTLNISFLFIRGCLFYKPLVPWAEKIDCFSTVRSNKLDHIRTRSHENGIDLLAVHLACFQRALVAFNSLNRIYQQIAIRISFYIEIQLTTPYTSYT